MPVDLSIGSGILRAYLAGLEERRNREKDLSDKEARAEALKEHSRQFDEKKRQEDEHFKKTFDAEQSTRALSNLQIKAAMTDWIEKNGRLLPGMEEHIKTNTSPEEDMASLNAGTYSDPNKRGMLRPGMTGPSLTREVTLSPELGGGMLNPLDSISAAVRDASRARILQAPKTDEEIRQALGIAAGEFPFKKELAQNQFVNQSALRTQQDTAAMARAKLLDDGRARDAKLRATSKITAGSNKHLDTYLTTADLQVYGMPQGTKYKDIQGMAPGKLLSPTENDKVNTLAAMVENIDKISKLGEDTNWSGVGPVAGRVGSLMTAINQGDPNEEMLRESLAMLKSDIGLMRAGKAFTKNEEAIIDKFLGTGTSSAQKIQVGLANIRPIIEAAKGRIFHPESLFKGGSNNPASGGGSIVDQLVNKHKVK